MPIVDIIIVGLTLAVAAWGYRQGVLTGLLMLVGFGGGALLGSRVAPLLLDGGLRDQYAPVLAVPGALLCGSVFAAVLERVGFGLRRGLRGRGRLDALGGALLAGILGLVLVWILAAAVARVDGLRGSIRDSSIVAGLNAVVPPPGPLLDADVSLPLPIIDGPEARGRPPGVNVKQDPEVIAAKASVVKIRVNFCGRGKAGSGWIAEDGIVVTNAHVVESADLIQLQLEGKGEAYEAEAIWYDRENDIAILRVPGVKGTPALKIETKPKPGTPGAMLGFPGGGPYVAKPVRLGATSTLPGNLLGRGSGFLVTRMIGRAIGGNSGGPVVDLKGHVLAVLFASKSPGYTAYGVPTSTVVRALRRAGEPADTGGCED